MINKRLIATVGECKKYIVMQVAAQWITLLANIVMMSMIAIVLGSLSQGEGEQNLFMIALLVSGVAILIRVVCTVLSSHMSYLSSATVKKKLRCMIYEKLLKVEMRNINLSTSEMVQVSTEGVEQLESYFASYLPQFFYALLAPLTLFLYLCFIDVSAAVILFVCVPLIPVSIVVVQRWAKKLLSKYWGQYSALGDSFLENLQGLATLKIYEADAYKHQKMNEEAEKFRKVTMKVLVMQLNSITIMDLIAYGGAALGIITAAFQFSNGNITFIEALLIIILSADFFIPMRLLGSYFHIAMNGVAASEKIFTLLDTEVEEGEEKEKMNGDDERIVLKDMSFYYDEHKKAIDHVHLSFGETGFYGIVGESGSGKSTLARILSGRLKGYRGSIMIGDKELNCIRKEDLMKHVTYISHQSYLFKGTIRENLLMGKNQANDAMLWEVLKQVRLDAFLEKQQGLDTMLQEKASNLSGGQCQRLALARAILHDSPVYIFDEATSSIDVESEDVIMETIHRLAENKMIIVISHRLANMKKANRLYVLDQGKLVEEGSHEQLLVKHGLYHSLWSTQYDLENWEEGDTYESKK